MKVAKIDGVALEYEDAGAGETVVCIHGAFIADTFRPVLAQPTVADQYRTIQYHRRGYVGSTRTAGIVSVNQQAADCGALLRFLDVERAHVVGHSYGGAVALQLALNEPDIVHSLALLEPGLMVGTSAQWYRESLEQATKQFHERGANVVVDAFMLQRTPGYRPLLDRVLPDAFTQAVADAGTTFDHELPGLLDWQFSEADARRIHQPTLSILGGKSDDIWSRFGETHQWILEWLPNAEGFVLPDTTHFMQIEDPEGLAESLAAFWSRQRSHYG